jgi:uncharacterized membrane protein
MQTNMALPAGGVVSIPNPRSLESFVGLPNLHPLVVHFPVVLLLLAPFFALIALASGNAWMKWTTSGLSLAGLLGAYLAAHTFHPMAAGLSNQASALLEAHDQWAFWSQVASAVLVVVATLSCFTKKWKRIFTVATLCLALCAAVLISLTGHAGGQLVHREGVGPQGRFLMRHP